MTGSEERAFESAIDPAYSFELTRLARCPQVRTLCFARQLSSTNDLALQLSAARSVELPALVLAERQVHGRGRGANRWWSSAGSLTFTWLVAPERFGITGLEQQLVPLAVGVALCEAAGQFLGPGKSCGVRWPNDVYLDGRKLAGILVERGEPAPGTSAGQAHSSDAGEQERHGAAARPVQQPTLVIGIGVNVNNSFESAPAELRQRAIALCQAAGRSLDLTEVLSACLRQLDRALHSLGQSRVEVLERCRSRLEMAGRRVVVQQPGRRIEGLCCGIAEDGALLVRSATQLERLIDGVVLSVE
jgi:BirA family biotin operon repressor/biotin-[acetyl-CoA-carboxylase] ligase